MRVRDAFFNEIYNLTKEGKDIVIVSSDLGAPSLDLFRKEFPHRFVNVGIAEQNAVAVAAGLQLAGKQVIYYGLNPFPVTRAFDQVRDIMESLQVPITVTALNAGTCSADAGYTHMAIENMSIMRTLTHVQLVNPSDVTMARKLAWECIAHPYPRYVQFDKFIEDTCYESDEDIDFEKGFISNQKESDVAVITYGIMSRKILDMNLPVKVIDCFALPLDEQAFIQEIQDAKKIVTVEDGVLSGGIGSMVLEILNDNGITIPVIRKGLRFSSGMPKAYVNRDQIFDSENLTDSDLRGIILDLLRG